jgi:sulfoxide reductase catalytic subunit YedY
MLIKKPSDIPSSEITPENVFHNRRDFIRNMTSVLGAGAIGAILPGCATAALPGEPQAKPAGKYDATGTTDKQTPFEDVTNYNNYYEFGTGKPEPAVYAKNFKTSPWTVAVEGMVKTPKTYALEDLLKGITMEDRVYRMRCVEAWSMVIPWHGIPLATLIKRLEPTPSAKYVEFQTKFDLAQMPMARRSDLNWPYTEGLRLDEAMNELAILAVGVYGNSGPPQNGAPLRLITPWKYGFKGAKAIVKIRFTDTQPKTAWNDAAPHEYGFYANVNPGVDHPRWSQASETRAGELFRRKTLMFNGYTDYVASMYSGLDLRKNY